MRILVVTPLTPPDPGGPSYYSVALKEALEGRGDEVDLIAFKEVRKYPSMIRHFLFLYKVLWKAKNVEALIILDTVSVALPAVLAGFILGKKMVVRVGGDFVWERYIERTQEKVLLSTFYISPRTIPLSCKERILIALQKHIVCKLAHKVVFNTQWQRDLWKEPYALSDIKTGVIQNALQRSLKKVKRGNTFLCAWRPTAVKNVDVLERAFQKAKERCRDIELSLYRNIPREELYTQMNRARALIIPSLTELSPNMALEALSMGLPVLLTQDCGARNLLDGFVTWIDPLSENDIAEKMCSLLNTDVYRKELERVGRFSYVHTYAEIAEEFLSFL